MAKGLLGEAEPRRMDREARPVSSPMHSRACAESMRSQERAAGGAKGAPGEGGAGAAGAGGAAACGEGGLCERARARRPRVVQRDRRMLTAAPAA